jgi:hypothetical protein
MPVRKTENFAAKICDKMFRIRAKKRFVLTLTSPLINELVLALTNFIAVYFITEPFLPIGMVKFA